MGKIAFPPAESYEEFLDDPMLVTDDWRQVSLSIDDKMNLDMLVQFRNKEAPLLCLLPSAQPRTNRFNPVYHRSSWGNEFPDTNLVVLSEPTLYLGEDLLGGWLIHPDIDLAQFIAARITEIAAAWGTGPNQILYYGSSMGGFEALQISAASRAASCVAEVPQLDMREYEFPAALEDIEKFVLKGSFIRHSRIHTEQISVAERFKFENYHPRARILTNRADHEFQSSLDLVREAAKSGSTAHSISMDIWSEPVGHQPLPRHVVVPLIKIELQLLGMEFTQHFEACPKVSDNLASVSAEDELEGKPYPQLVEEANKICALIEYTRDGEDAKRFEKALLFLTKIADKFPNEDWPLRKACTVLKSWELNYTARFTAAAKEAFRRKQSLETLVYVCRGILATEPEDTILAQLRSLRVEEDDPDLHSVIDVFIATAMYSAGDLNGYEQKVREIRSELRSGFETYLLIPFRSVMLSDEVEEAGGGEPLIGEIREELSGILAESFSNEIDYSVVTSCDSIYLSTFGSYLVESFELSRESRSEMLIVVLGDETECADTIANLRELSKHVHFVFVEIELRENLAPASSLIRFLPVHNILERTGRPVVLMDTDAVIVKDLQELIAQSDKSDVAIRVLGGNLASWERYAAGIVVFHPTDASKEIALDAAKGGAAMLRPGDKQWWIDQNALEYGIRRWTLLEGSAPHITNLMSISTEALVLPVGPRDAKVKRLTSAIKKLRGQVSRNRELE